MERKYPLKLSLSADNSVIVLDQNEIAKLFATCRSSDFIHSLNIQCLAFKYLLLIIIGLRLIDVEISALKYHVSEKIFYKQLEINT